MAKLSTLLRKITYINHEIVKTRPNSLCRQRVNED